MSDVVHYYAGWPGKVLCESQATSPISSIHIEQVTCAQCWELLNAPTAPREVIIADDDGDEL